MGSVDNDSTATVLMRQTLMVAQEVYLYKIPPLKTSGGHRADDWNLAAPLATCSLLVERRGDCLVLEFKRQEDGSVFAQAIVDCSVPKEIGATYAPSSNAQQQHQPPPQQRRIQHWLEGTVDSSRYFTLKIVSSTTGREAIIGFGFRDRDQATDLRESMQHYETAMRREHQAMMMMVAEDSPMGKFTIPKLAEGERIHVHTGKEGSTASSTNAKPKQIGIKTGLPLLLKKPPPSPESAAKLKLQSDISSLPALKGLEAEIDSVDNAWDDNDDDDWDTEFVSANG